MARFALKITAVGWLIRCVLESQLVRAVESSRSRLRTVRSTVAEAVPLLEQQQQLLRARQAQALAQLESKRSGGRGGGSGAGAAGGGAQSASADASGEESQGGRVSSDDFPVSEPGFLVRVDSCSLVRRV